MTQRTVDLTSSGTGVLEATPTAPLPTSAAKVLARLEAAFAPVVAEQYRVERIVAGLRDGESTIINGTKVTAVSLKVAEALTVYEVASRRVRKLSDLAATGDLSDLDADSLAHAEDLMAGARAVLAKAGRLDLVDGA